MGIDQDYIPDLVSTLMYSWIAAPVLFYFYKKLKWENDHLYLLLKVKKKRTTERLKTSKKNLKKELNND